jgi:hypothetical protein
MRARGIELEDAKSLLTGAFARGVIARIKNPELRASATRLVDTSLEILNRPSETPASFDSGSDPEIQ